MSIVIASKQQKSRILHVQRCPRISTQLRVRSCNLLIFKSKKNSLSVLSPTHEEHDISVGTSVGNCVVSYSVLLEMIDMTVCKECLVGQMKIFDTQTRCGCASHLLLTCLDCKISKQFWSVHGNLASRTRSIISRFQN